MKALLNWKESILPGFLYLFFLITTALIPLPSVALAGWQEEDVDTTASSFPSLAYDQNGNAGIAYSSTGAQLKYAHKNGNAWAVGPVNAEKGTDLSLAMDPAGNPAISYSGVDGLYLARFNEGMWTTSRFPSIFEDKPIYIAYNTSLAFDSFGNPAIAYIWAWGLEGYVVFGGKKVEEGYRSPSLAFDQSGQAGIAYSKLEWDSTRSDWSHHLRFWGCNSESCGISNVDSGEHIGGHEIALAFDPSGKPAISYTYGALAYTHFDGNAWNKVIVDSRAIGDSKSLAFDKLGNPAIAYRSFYGNDCVQGCLHYAYFDGEAWKTIKLGPGGGYASLAFDKNGNPGIAHIFGGVKYVHFQPDSNNLPPVILPIGNKSIQVGQTIQFTLAATDPEGGPAFYYATNLPSGASLNRNTGAFTWTPAPEQAGTYNIQFSVADNAIPPAIHSETVSIQVLPATGNLVGNDGFENDVENDGYADVWSDVQIDRGTGYESNSSGKLVNNGTKSLYGNQIIQINRKVSGFTFGAWNKLFKNSETNAGFSKPWISLRCWYEDGTPQIAQGVLFSGESHDWQFGSNYFKTDENKVLTKLVAEVWWLGDGIAWFDNFQVIEGRVDLNGDGLYDGTDTGPMAPPNLVANFTFEKDDNNDGYADVWSDVYIDRTTAYAGNSSGKLLNDGTKSLYGNQIITVNRKVSGFTFGARNKLLKYSGTNAGVSQPWVSLRCWYENGTPQIAQGVLFGGESHDWQFGSNYFRTDENKVLTKLVAEVWWLGDGIAWFDNFQVIEGRVDLNGDGIYDGTDTGPLALPNLVANFSFEKDDNNDGLADAWDHPVQIDRTTSVSGLGSGKMINQGMAVETSYAVQYIPINRKVDGFRLSGWNKLEKHSDAWGVDPRRIFLSARFCYEDGTCQGFAEGVPFSKETHNWEYKVGYFQTDGSKVMTGIEVWMWWVGDGIAWFDDVQLVEGANQPPIANAGPPQTVHVGGVVTLDGSSSSDPDGNVPLNYFWTLYGKPLGSFAELSDPTSVNPTFTADKVGDYTLRLIVRDSLGSESSPGTVLISTNNSVPLAEAGPDQSIMSIGTIVMLDGSGSYDDDGDAISYGWTLLSKPLGSSAELINANSNKPTFVADKHGDYAISLVVSDPWATSAPDTVTVSFENLKPVANAGTSQMAVVGNVVTLDGSGSFDANGDPLGYKWSLNSAPIGSSSTITSPLSPQTWYVPDRAGTYVVQLIVNDGFVNSDPSLIQIQVVTQQTAVVQKAQNLINQIASMDDRLLKNQTMKNAMINKVNSVIGNIEAGHYQGALGQLKNDILQKTDGCASAGAPDKNDWIVECSEQALVYPRILEIIASCEKLL